MKKEIFDMKISDVLGKEILYISKDTWRKRKGTVVEVEPRYLGVMNKYGNYERVYYHQIKGIV